MRREITGVVLAGGKSSRMGTDKGVLLVNGKSMVDSIIGVLAPLVNDILIIANGTNYNYLPYTIYPDRVKDSGPMGGIYTALSHSKTNKNMVLSCDMPFITAGIIEVLINHPTESDIVVPIHGNQIEPLCAIYDKGCIEKMGWLIENKELKLINAFKHFNVQKIIFEENKLNGHCFTNINTPAEYERIKYTGMKIQVKVFGQLAEVIGSSELTMMNITDTQSLREKIVVDFPGLNAFPFAIAVDKKISKDNRAIKAGDEIALLPPFSGG